MKKSSKDHTGKKRLEIMCFDRHWKLKACIKAFMLVQIFVFYFKTSYFLLMSINFDEFIYESKVAINIFYGI